MRVPHLRNLPWLAAVALALLVALPGCFMVDETSDPPPVEEPPAEEPPAEEPPAEEPPAEEPPAEEPPAEEPAIVFAIPSDGATVVAPTLLTVTGDVTSVRFEVDGDLAFDDTAAPFAWTLNPVSYAQGSHRVDVRAAHAGGEEVRTINVTLQPAPTGPDQPQEVLDAVRDLAPGHWYEIPNTHLKEVAPTSGIVGGSVSAVIKAWSGGAFDTKRDRLIVWGGGHADYSGNEIYVFDMTTLKWSRITDPSPFPADDPYNEADAGAHPDGAPISRHSYNYIAYIPDPIDKFYVGGGNGIWSSGQFGDNNTYLFDFDTLEWEIKSKTPEAYIGACCAVAPDGTVWQHSNYRGLSSYDAATDTWTKHVAFDGWWGYSYTCEFDPVRNRLLGLGKGQVLVWDADNPHAEATVLPTSGDDDIENGSSIGLAYHPGSDRLVAWSSGASVHALDLKTNVWKKIETSGTVSPGAPPSQGTYGRFRYSPKSDLFVIVNDVEKNVFVYRLPSP